MRKELKENLGSQPSFFSVSLTVWVCLISSATSPSISDPTGACLLRSSGKQFPQRGNVCSPGAFFLCGGCQESFCGLPKAGTRTVQPCFYRKMCSEFRQIYFLTNFGTTTFPLVEDCHCVFSRSGFYSLLIYKRTMDHFFAEGPELEVFSSGLINYCIKMNIIHPANIGSLFWMYL